MRTFHKNRKKKKTLGRTLILIGVVLVVIEIFWHPLRTSFLGSTAPILETALNQKEEGTLLLGRIFTSERDLQQKISDLQEQVYALQFENKKSHLVRKENESLRTLLGFKDEGDLREGELAQVIQRPSGIQTDQIMVLVGGVYVPHLGVEAFVGPYRLGKVSGVIGKLVTIDLYSQESVVRGILADESLDLQSQGAMLFMSQIPRSVEVEIGDVITLEQFPNDPFVVVTDIVTDEIDPFKTIFAKLPIPFSEISYVTLQ